ncbi:MAG: hypothetical protein GX556_07800 [Fibrobacter sp.]|nr:hypothetical protein [Fibrobacter sp.]
MHLTNRYIAILITTATLFFLYGCSGDVYTKVTYGGSFLMDSVTVGFFRTENTIEDSDNAWWGGSYIDGKQEILIYSVPQQKVIKKISFTTGRSASSMEGTVPVVYSKPWIMYDKYHESHSLGLYNLETGEKIALADCTYNSMGGFSPDGKYAFFFKQTKSVDGYKILKTTYLYNISEKRVTDSVQISNVFYLAQNAQFFLFTIAENPLYSNKTKWIIKSDFNNDSPENWDTVYTMPDSLWFINMTDFHTAINLTNKYFSLDSLLNKKLYQIYLPEQKIFKYSGIVADITFSTGVYTYGAASGVYIGGIYGNYLDTLFQSEKNWE